MRRPDEGAAGDGSRVGTSGVGVRFSVVSIQLFRPVNIFIIIGYIGFESTSSDLI